VPVEKYGSINAALATMRTGITSVIYHRGDATGDIPHVLAALANDPTRGVIVMDGKNSTAGGLSKVGNVMVDHFGIPTDRVKFVESANKVPEPPKGGQRRIVNSRVFTMYPLTKSTNFLRDDLALKAVNPHVFKNVKAALRGPTLHSKGLPDDPKVPLDVVDLNFLDPQCAAFWVGKHIDFKRNTVVLWGRESGRVGGMHPDHDHSYTGMRQIVEACIADDPPSQVIVAGDYREKATAPRQTIQDNAIVIGKYWDDVPLFKNRQYQVRLFYVLKKMLKVRGRRLVHVGMRSGGLDMFGFSGQKTIYVSRAAGDQRMEPVVQQFADVGLQDTFQKHTATRLPKRGPSGSAKKGERSEDQRGFAPDDLTVLMSKIKSALAG
jgi:hypothetical protein